MVYPHVYQQQQIRFAAGRNAIMRTFSRAMVLLGCIHQLAKLNISMCTVKPMPEIDRISMFSIRIFGWKYLGCTNHYYRCRHEHFYYGHHHLHYHTTIITVSTHTHTKAKIESNSEALNFPPERRYINNSINFVVRSRRCRQSSTCLAEGQREWEVEKER